MIERKEDCRLTVYPIDDEEDRPVTDYIAEAIEGQYGERCPEFVEGCAVCEAWAQYDDMKARVDSAEKALSQFQAHYPMGINPFLDDASRAARAHMEKYHGR